MAFELKRFVVYSTDGESAGAIDLNQECGVCDGTGIVVDRGARTFTDCEACAGSGARLTYEGRDLLRFIRDNSGHPDLEVEDLP